VPSAGKKRGKNRDYGKLFHDSYLRCVVSDQDGFFERFYQLFMAADPEISKMFARTDMDRQISLLQESLLHMIDFSNSKVANERMQRIATYHGSSELDIPVHMFDLWMDRLIATVRERDTRCNSQIETAWRVFLAPGIAFMKSHCSSWPGGHR
jgi:hemoglobin-like flavoprotein